MLLPALSKAREKARASGCINNLKQLGLAQMSYAGDNSDYPCMVYAGGGDAHYFFSKEQLGVYVSAWLTSATYDSSGVKLYYCGSDMYPALSERPNQTGLKGGTAVYSAKGWNPISYGLNNQILPNISANLLVNSSYKKLTGFRSPSKTYLGGDGISNYICRNNDVGSSYSSYLDGPMQYWRIIFRHSNRSNAMWFDGHVSALEYREIPENPNTATQAGGGHCFWYGK